MQLSAQELADKGLPANFRDELYDTVQAMDDACGELLSERQRAILSMIIGVAREHEEDWWTEDEIREFCGPGYGEEDEG